MEKGTTFSLILKFIFPSKSQHACIQEDKEALQLERLKIAYLPFRVSVSVFVLVSQCKFKRVIFLDFFICHFFTHSLSVMKII